MRRLISLLATASALVVAATLSAAPSASAAEPAYTVREDLHFRVQVGPEGNQTCDVVGDLYEPTGASGVRRPAILTTNGFGGSKDDQDALSAYAAEQGYVALTYSGLGFGGSSCEITLDDPDFDGRAAAQLIDFLGGESGIAYEDAGHTVPVPALDSVQLDGDAEAKDPRVGMVGGSYGGQVQYAAAASTAKLDTIVPIITWNDLSYSLGPNNTDQIDPPPQVSTRTPGPAKMNWALAFSAIGLTGDAANQQPDNPVRTRCPNFAAFVCPALVRGATTGALGDEDVANLRHASVRSYASDVTVPTLIMQGQADTLFNLNEAAATYEALQAQGVDVKMSWIEFGHSGEAAPGELDLENPDQQTQHVTKRIFDWFGHHLKDDDSPTGPEFSYFRDWVDYEGIATPAYGESGSYPVGKPSTYHLSSTPQSTATGGTLVTDRDDVTEGRQAFVTTPTPAPDEDADVIGTFLEQPERPEPTTDPAGSAARYTTDPLSRDVDVVGSPQVRLQVQAPTAAATEDQNDAGKLVVYLKIRDLAPDGGSEVVRNLAAPVRFPNADEPVTVTMPGFVHRFESGHRIRLSVAGSSPNYRGGTAAVPVEVLTGGATTSDVRHTASATSPLPLQSITLPTLTGVPASGTAAPPADGESPEAPGNGSSGDDSEGGDPATGSAGSDRPSATANNLAAAASPTASPAASSLPDTGGPSVWLVLLGLLLLVAGAGVRSRAGSR